MTASLYVQGANIDVGAEVLVDGATVATIAHKALVKPMFAVESFLKYPIHHYVALAAVMGPKAVGQPVTIRVRNLDATLSDPYRFDVPASAAVLDSDGDALPDAWERTYDGDGSGQADADPYRKDIFVELDTMIDVTIAPPADAIEAVRTMFRAAPLMNPYGDDGIALHVDTSGTVPFSERLVFDEASEIPPPIEGVAPPAVFSALKPPHFDHSDLGDVYHYVVWAQRLTTDRAGMSDMPLGGGGGDDAVIAIASYPTAYYTTRTVAEVLAHELGHNLGQRHGGKTHQDLNPSYFSVLSGAWVMRTSRDVSARRRRPTCFPFFYATAGADEGPQHLPLPNQNSTLVVDYSAGMGPDLVEGPLDETKGMCGHPIDWNRGGRITPPPPPIVDVNQNNVHGETLSDYANWPNLIFNGPASNGTIP
jgi:hypothetical protein